MFWEMSVTFVVIFYILHIWVFFKAKCLCHTKMSIDIQIQDILQSENDVNWYRFGVFIVNVKHHPIKFLVNFIITMSQSSWQKKSMKIEPVSAQKFLDTEWHFK